MNEKYKVDSDKEEYYQAKIELAIKLSENHAFSDAIKANADMFNQHKDIRYINAMNALMKVMTGNNHWACNIGRNQHGVWKK